MDDDAVTKNMKAVIAEVNRLRNEYEEKFKYMENLLFTQTDQLSQLQHKYNLLLTSRFNSGPTEH